MIALISERKVIHRPLGGEKSTRLQAPENNQTSITKIFNHRIAGN
jgi:hypothetical protein